MDSCTWEKDYIRYIRLNLWIDVNSQGYNKHQIYELNNCVTRFFISRSLPNADQDKVYAKFVQELKDKKLKSCTDIRDFTFFKLQHVVNIPLHFDVTVNTDNVLFVCGDFEGEITRERYEVLRVVGSDEEILCMLLRYTTFSSGSFGWQVPLKVYKQLHEKHGLTLEGCASPINSQMKLLDCFGGRYCSPFIEDGIFGSMGSIFDTDLEGEIALLNPPFVEDFMLFLANRVIKVLDSVCNTESNSLSGKGSSHIDSAVKPTTIIFVSPEWTDAKSHMLLSNCKWLKNKYNLLKGNYGYAEATKGNMIKATFNSTIFVLSTLDEFDISDAIELFKI
jgi:hypothetical protein